MAKLYYCNNGDIELRHETLQELRAMPDSWTVLLNCRPAGKNVDSEIDALVVTQKALHIIEFKYRTAPVQIKTESSWLAGKYEIRSNWGESPKEQVTRTDTAFKQWLQQTLPELKKHTLPWVVLERHNNLNCIGTNAFNPGFYEKLGHVTVLSGVEKLTQSLQNRENSAKNLPSQAITAENHAQLIREVGAKQLDTMTVQGKVVSLEENRPLPHVPVHIRFEGALKSNLNFDPLRFTDENGYFEFNGIPLQSFSLDIENDGSWQVLPTGIRQPAGIVIAPIFLASKKLSEKYIKELLQASLQQLKEEMMLEIKVNIEDIEACFKTSLLPMEEEIDRLEQRIKDIEQEAEKAATAAQSASEAAASKEAQEEQARIERDKWKKALADKKRDEELLALRVEALMWSAIVGAAGGIIALQPIPFADNLILTPMQIGLVMWIGKRGQFTVIGQKVLLHLSSPDSI